MAYKNRVKDYLLAEDEKAAGRSFKACSVVVTFVEAGKTIATYATFCTSVHDMALAVANFVDQLPAIRRIVAYDHNIRLDRLVAAKATCQIQRPGEGGVEAFPWEGLLGD